VSSVPEPAPALDARPSAPFGLEAARLRALLDAAATEGLFHLSADEQRAREVAVCLAAIAPEREVLLFPPWDCLPYDTAAPSAEAMGQRMAVLSRLAADLPPPVVVTSPEAAMQRVPPPGALRAFAIRLCEELDADALRSFCRGAGYAIDERVDEPGEVAIRSGVIDISPGDQPEPFRLSSRKYAWRRFRLYDPGRANYGPLFL
jgi:transcription-repair coupling factor (superfamily II helicase)